MVNQKLKNFLKDPRTNWKFILVIIILAAIVGGGILGYYYLWIRDLKVKLVEIELKLSEVKLPEEIPPREVLEGERVRGPESKIIDQLTADLKSTGRPLLVTLVSQVKEVTEFGEVKDYFVRIYTDTTGQIIEYEGPPIESDLAPGFINTIYNPATGRLTIQHIEGAGAHSTVSQFIHWTDSEFEEIKAVDKNGQPIFDPWFGDGSGATLQPDGIISVGFRNYDCPLSASATHIYKWKGTAYQFVKTEIEACPSE